MKILVEKKKNEDGSLIFTITCTEPHQAAFNDKEGILMHMLERYKGEVSDVAYDSTLQRDLLESFQNIKCIVFDEIQDCLTNNIKYQLEPKFDSIKKQIFSWILSYQSEPLKKWVSEFRPYEENFYFDNEKSENDQKKVQ